MKNPLGWFTKAPRSSQAKQTGASESGATATPPVNPPFEPNNELERALMAAAVAPESRRAFQQMLLRSDVLAATPEAPAADGTRSFESGEQLPLLTVKSPDGSSVAAIFTSQPRIVEMFGPDAGFIRMQGRALLEIVAGTGAFLNPGSAYRVHWDPAGIGGLLGRPVTRMITQPTKLLLATPSEPPVGLVAQLRSILGSRSDVPEAWFALAHWPENGEYSWYLDVRTHLPRAEITAMLAEVFKGAPFEGRPLDMIVRKAGGPNGVGLRISPAAVH